MSKELLDAIISGNSIDLEAEFNKVADAKIAERLETFRQEVGASMFNESVEQELTEQEVNQIAEEILDELSKDTLGSYINKALSDRDKASKRFAGIKNATAKLTKEQAELVQAELDKLDEGTHYHSVWYKGKGDNQWSHHFDADTKEDADEEKSSLKNAGDKVKVLKVHKSQADWRKPEHREAAIKRLSESESELDEEKILEDILALDELSKDTLKSYINKAAISNHNSGFKAGEKWSKGDMKGAVPYLAKSLSRAHNIGKAAGKLTKEQSEIIDTVISEMENEEV